MRNLPLLLLVACGGPPEEPPAVDTDPCPLATEEPGVAVDLSAIPFAQVVGDTVRLRFEVHGTDVAVPVTLDLGEACGAELEVTRDTAERSFAWPSIEGLDVSWPDRPGAHTLHEVVFADLEPGERYTWTVHAGPGQTLSGSFRAPPPAETPFTAVFVGDTMAPADLEVHAAMADAAPDLYLHGGDFQYQTIPSDTWSGSLRAAAPVLETALFHVAPGNHEYEGYDEHEQLFRRWFDGAGQDAEASWHAVDYGGVRFLLLDSEDGLEDPDSPQLAWIADRLAEADAAGLPVIPIFHRPAWTVGSHTPRTDIRDAVTPLFQAHGVRLVLAGHNHVYERFLVDGVTWIVDGGGGALLTNPDAQVEALPDEAALRQAVSSSHGYLTLRFEGGSVELTRRDTAGAVVDSTTVSLTP